MNKGETTRQRIIQEAASLFNRRGYAGCSMQDLMEASGLEKGGIYRHFANKQELALEAFRYSLAINTKVRTEPLAEVAGAVEKLRRAVRIFIEEPSAIPGGCPLMNTAIDADDANPPLRALALKGLHSWRGSLANIVKEGVRAGEIRTDTQPRTVANAIISTLEGALMISRLERNKNALADAQRTLEVLFEKISTTTAAGCGTPTS